MLKIEYILFIYSFCNAQIIAQTLRESLDPSPRAPRQLREEFHEELYVQPLDSGHVNTYFQFTTRWHYGAKSNLHNTRLMPRSIAEILLQYDVKELHIHLTQGLWRYETWGYPVVDAAPGAEVWAWFSTDHLTERDVDEQWIRVASTFSGILCASLNFIDKTNSVSPKYGFRPQFASREGNASNSRYVRYATLPREIVCTENLTPWKKLLPCNSRNGFASLLNSGQDYVDELVHNTNYHSLSVRVRTFCESADNCILELIESANLVYDPKILFNRNGNNFSLRRLFGQGLNGYCVLAQSSKIYVNLRAPFQYELSPQPMYNVSSIRGGATSVYGVYDIQQVRDRDTHLFNIAWIGRKDEENEVSTSPPPPLYAHRYIMGHGQEKGQIITLLTNDHYASLPVVVQENIPWYVPVYMHTLRLTNRRTGERIEPKVMHYLPGVQRTRPYHLELAFELPAKSLVEIAFDFDYIFLKWLEYPPDANHGHYLGSAVISTLLPIARNYSAVPLEGYLFADTFNATRAAYFLTLHTEPLILSLPTPDFSMPYNVICLACTVVALAFGPIHSVTTKRIVVEQRDASSNTFIGRLFSKITRRKRPLNDNCSGDGAECDTPELLHEKSE